MSASFAQRFRCSAFKVAFGLLTCCALVCHSDGRVARAATYTWNTKTSGLNWNANQWGGGFPNATDDVANILQNINSATTININGTYSLGTLNIGDSNGSDTYTLNGTGTLNLSVTTGTPIINTTNTGLTTTISAFLGGNQGFQKNGSADLTLTADNSSTLSGTVTISVGTINANAAGALGSGPVVVAGGTLTENTTNALKGTQSLTVSSGTATLSVANSYSGGTTFSGGTLTASIAGALGTGDVLVNGGTLTLSTTNSMNGGSQALNVSSGSATLSAAQSYGGGTTVSGGTLNANIAGALGSGNVLINGGTFTESTTNALTGAQSFTLSSGSATLNRANNYSGGSTFSGGTLTVSIARALGSGDVLVNGGTFAPTAANVFGSGATPSSKLTVSSGTATLASSNDHTGGVSLNGGTLNINNAGALGSGTLTLIGGTFDNSTGAAITVSTNNAQSWGGAFTFTGTQNLNLGTGAVTLTSNAKATVTGAAAILTVGGVIDDGINSFDFSKAGSGIILLNGASTFGGATNLLAGTIRLGAANRLPTGTSLVLGDTGTGGTLDLNTFSQTVGSLTTSGTATASKVINGSTGTPTFTINYSGGSPITYGGQLGNGGSGNGFNVAKSGSGTLVISNTSNSYTGSTSVSGGILQLGAAGVIPNANTFSLSSGTLSTGSGAGFTETIGALNITGSGSTISLGTGVHTLTFASLDATGFTSLTVNGWTGTASASGTAGKIVFTSTTAFTSGILGNITFTGYEPGAKFIAGNELVPVQVPEPFAGLAIALGALGLLRGRSLSRRQRILTRS